MFREKHEENNGIDNRDRLFIDKFDSISECS